ncbi:MAG: tetraacyldisaccharide 4'-kinase [Succinivibrio sp.]
MSFIDEVWYGRNTPLNVGVRTVLLPFTALFWAISSTRRFLYKSGFLKKHRVDVPVIVVGGISVGGSGKTPLCIDLIEHLYDKGYKVGLLSRGYRSLAPTYPFVVETRFDAKTCGDEPYLIKKSLEDKVKVVIDPVRSRGAKYLCSLGVNVIVMDDGLQHYALDRDLELIVLDGKRMLGNGLLMPSGPLREGKHRLNKTEFVIVNGKSSDDTTYGMTLVPDDMASSLKDGSSLEPQAVVALAGIGNPSRFYKTLESKGYKVIDTIDVLDHHLADPEVLKEKVMNYPVVMTAKDAVKYTHFNIPSLYVLNVRAKLSHKFYDKLYFRLDKIIESKK